MNLVLELLPGIFLVGALLAALSIAGMIREACRFRSEQEALAGGGLGVDPLEKYRRRCSEECRTPLLWYTYQASLGVGMGALILAFL